MLRCMGERDGPGGGRSIASLEGASGTIDKLLQSDRECIAQCPLAESLVPAVQSLEPECNGVGATASPAMIRKNEGHANHTAEEVGMCRGTRTYGLPRPPGGAPVSPSPMARAETEKALAEDSAGRVSLVKDWRSIFADVSGREESGKEKKRV